MEIQKKDSDRIKTLSGYLYKYRTYIDYGFDLFKIDFGDEFNVKKILNYIKKEKIKDSDVLKIIIYKDEELIYEDVIIKFIKDLKRLEHKICG